MPKERVYTIRGKAPAALTHQKIQLSSYDPKMMYQIIEFKVMPAGTPQNSDCYGTVSMGKNDNIDPTDPDFSNQNEIAWAHHAVRQPVPPGLAESVIISNYEVNDEKLFNYDIWMHTRDALNNEEVNFFLKILKYSVGAVEGSIGSLRQQQYNDQENQ
jgi:hypothetical protein